MTQTLLPDTQISRGISTDSNELLFAQGQSYRDFYHASAIIQNYKVPEVMRSLQTISSEPLFKIITMFIDKINVLKTWGVDLFDCPAPDYSTIRNAKNWITRFYFQVAFENWSTPNVTSGPAGEVVFEWWNGIKKVTIYVSSQNVEYVQVWGTDIYEEMSEGDAEPIEVCKELWSWLKS